MSRCLTRFDNHPGVGDGLSVVSLGAGVHPGDGWVSY